MNVNDLVVGLDPTSSTSITGAQLAQMVNGATPSSDRGLLLYTRDANGVPVIPDANATPEFQRYIWIRLTPLTSSFTAYVWNSLQAFNLAYSDTSGTTVATYWNPITNSGATIGQITNSQLAGGITYDKLAGGIQLSQIANSNSLLTTATVPSVTTQINGSFAGGFFLNNASVGAGVLAANSVATTNLQNNSVTVGKFDNTGLATQLLGNTALNTPGWVTPPQIYTGLANPNAGGSDDGKVVAVNSGAAGTFKYVAATTNAIVKAAFASTTTAYNVSSAGADSASSPTNAVTMTALTTAFVPSSNSDYLIVEAVVPVYAGGANNTLAGTWAYLYAGSNIIAAAKMQAIVGAPTVGQVPFYGTITLKAKVSTPGTSSISFTVQVSNTLGFGGACHAAETASLSIQEWTL
jgi:hypothetical protein